MSENKEVVKKRLSIVHHYKHVFSSDEGKRVLWDILKQGNILASSHSPGCPNETAYQEGRRSLALDILKKLKTDTTQLEKYLEKGEEYERDSGFYDV